MQGQEDELFESLRKNLLAMYHGTDSNERRKADRWLQKLQRDTTGWSVADAILGGRTPLVGAQERLGSHAACEALIFAAMTLHVKVCGDIHELSDVQKNGLRDAALEHLARWGCGPAAGSTPPAVVKKIALAVAALAVQTSWDGALMHISQQLEAAESRQAEGLSQQKNIISFSEEAALVEATCRSKRIAIELLAALPEQCEARRLCVSRARREGYQSFLKQNANNAVNAITMVVAQTHNALAILSQHHEKQIKLGTPGEQNGENTFLTQNRGHKNLFDWVKDATQRLNLSALICLQSWISFSEVEAQVLAVNPLFLGTFDAVNHPFLFEVATDVIIEALRAYDCLNALHQPVVAVIAPRVMALRPRFEQANNAGDEDDCFALCRLFCEMGEAYMPLIASTQDANQLTIIELELLCANHPARRVATLPLRFFYNLSRAWSQMPEDEGKMRLREAMIDPFLRLARCCLLQSERTEEDGSAEDFARDEHSLGDDFSRHRADLADCLGDCAFFLGYESVLKIIGERIRQILSIGIDGTPTPRRSTSPIIGGTSVINNNRSNPADALEACFFALRAVSEWVPDTESVILPETIRLLPSLESSWRSAIRAGTACVSAYTFWLRNYARELLEPVVTFLVSVLEANAAAIQRQKQKQIGPNNGRGGRIDAQGHRRLPTGPSPAARALKAVCSTCRRELARLGALDLRDRLVAAGLSHRDELELLEGLGHVISACDQFDDICRGFERLITPPAMALSTLVSRIDAPADTKLVAEELERLTSIVRCTTPSRQHFGLSPSSHDTNSATTTNVATPLTPTINTVLNNAEIANRRHPVLSFIEKLWPVFEAVAERYGDSPQLIERLCRCYKHAMRSCRTQFEPMLEQMIDHLVRHFSKTPLSSYVYASSICITEFGRDSNKHGILFEMLTKLSATVFCLFRSLDDFRQRPDVAEEYFYLTSRFLDYCPDHLVHSPLLESVLRCGIVGLALEHREAQRGILHCFERTVVVAYEAALNASQNGDPSTPDARRAAALATLLVEQQLGRLIADGVLKALTGDLPAYALDEGHGSLVGVLWRLRLFCPNDLPRWCANSLQNVPERYASNDIKSDLMVSIAEDPAVKDSFCDALLLFSARCRDLAKVLR
uniref:Exportin-1/Importin-beta-like domain-containing protein n=1 Tax=Aureoumbra lagunensis TaxID=44058 RepID=A0A7S3NIA9_9STRA|mmetsp:Transcript_12629/g.18942  ORF Transcript_12629/g.18942 Transcript_12629/m.18942 type:complete len:1131 (+) Transcript_12629:81-3473(+)